MDKESLEQYLIAMGMAACFVEREMENCDDDEEYEELDTTHSVLNLLVNKYDDCKVNSPPLPRRDVGSEQDEASGLEPHSPSIRDCNNEEQNQRSPSNNSAHPSESHGDQNDSPYIPPTNVQVPPTFLPPDQQKDTHIQNKPDMNSLSKYSNLNNQMYSGIPAQTDGVVSEQNKLQNSSCTAVAGVTTAGTSVTGDATEVAELVMAAGPGAVANTSPVKDPRLTIPSCLIEEKGEIQQHIVPIVKVEETTPPVGATTALEKAADVIEDSRSDASEFYEERLVFSPVSPQTLRRNLQIPPKSDADNYSEGREAFPCPILRDGKGTSNKQAQCAEEIGEMSKDSTNPLETLSGDIVPIVKVEETTPPVGATTALDTAADVTEDSRSDASEFYKERLVFSPVSPQTLRRNLQIPPKSEADNYSEGREAFSCPILRDAKDTSNKQAQCAEEIGEISKDSTNPLETRSGDRNKSNRHGKRSKKRKHSARDNEDELKAKERTSSSSEEHYSGKRSRE